MFSSAWSDFCQVCVLRIDLKKAKCVTTTAGCRVLPKDKKALIRLTAQVRAVASDEQR